MPPKSEQQYQQIREKRKEEILSAALELFAEQGYHRTSISEIAKKAGISKGLLYNYFKDKKDLLVQVSVFTIEQTVNEIFSLLKNPQKPLSPQEQVIKGIDLYFDMLVKKAYLWKLSMALALQTADIPEIAQMMDEVFQRFFAEIEQILAATGVPNAAAKAKLLAAQLDGIALHYFALGKAYDLKQMKQELIQNLLINK